MKLIPVFCSECKERIAWAQEEITTIIHCDECMDRICGAIHRKFMNEWVNLNIGAPKYDFR